MPFLGNLNSDNYEQTRRVEIFVEKGNNTTFKPRMFEIKNL